MNLLFTCKKKRVFEKNNEFYNRRVIVKKIFIFIFNLFFSTCFYDGWVFK